VDGVQRKQQRCDQAAPPSGAACSVRRRVMHAWHTCQRGVGGDARVAAQASKTCGETVYRNRHRCSARMDRLPSALRTCAHAAARV
jgi:hypothetical protein